MKDTTGRPFTIRSNSVRKMASISSVIDGSPQTGNDMTYRMHHVFPINSRLMMWRFEDPSWPSLHGRIKNPAGETVPQ